MHLGYILPQHLWMKKISKQQHRKIDLEGKKSIYRSSDYLLETAHIP